MNQNSPLMSCLLGDFAHDLPGETPRLLSCGTRASQLSSQPQHHLQCLTLRLFPPPHDYQFRGIWNLVREKYRDTVGS